MCVCVHTCGHAHLHAPYKKRKETLSDNGNKDGDEKTGDLETLFKQVNFEGNFEKDSRMRVAEHFRHTSPNRWASVRLRPLFVRSHKGQQM